MPDKSKFIKEMWISLWPQLLTAPQSQLSPALMKRIRAFKVAEATDKELFDFLVQLSHEPVTELSAFMVEIFKVDKYYEKP